LIDVVAGSLARLRASHDIVVIEGAGSSAEINLAASEIVNMRVARLADAVVLLATDIDRGGAFAALVGTLALLGREDRQRVAGFLINRFRGDLALLRPGLDMLTARTGVPVLGVVPMLAERLVPAEDSLDLDRMFAAVDDPRVDIAVVRVPRISNFDDFEPLAGEPDVRMRLVHRPADVAGADMIVLPGSKTTIADLEWLHASGMGEAVRAHAARGGPVLGICGGLQMLGRRVDDPHGVEGAAGSSAGLALLPVSTTLARAKRTARVRARVRATRGVLADAAGLDVSGYEIHVGDTEHAGDAAFTILSRSGAAAAETDGAVSADGAVTGTYVHGLFANDELRGHVLRALARRAGRAPNPQWGRARPALARYDQLADSVADSVDMPAIAKLVGLCWPHRPR
jgi:adenosylcobyric acid synthase